jgi:hypothetical protein
MGPGPEESSHHEEPHTPSTPTLPIARLKAYRTGHGSAPTWQFGEIIEGPETDLLLAEEEMAHPEVRPLLCLYNMDDEGTTLGEVWFAPADIPAIIAFLQWQWTDNYASGQRRWLNNDHGPSLYFGDTERRQE